MITRKIKILLILIGLFCANTESFSQVNKNPINKKPINRILFVFDASQSMLGRWQSGRKIDIAKKLLSNITDSLKDVENLELALRVYGHQSSYPPQECNDTKFRNKFPSFFNIC